MRRTDALARRWHRAAGLADLASAPWAGSVTRLVLKRNQAGRTNALATIGNAPLTYLRTFYLCNYMPYDDPEFTPVADARALAESPMLARLRSLSLTDLTHRASCTTTGRVQNVLTPEGPQIVANFLALAPWQR